MGRRGRDTVTPKTDKQTKNKTPKHLRCRDPQFGGITKI